MENKETTSCVSVAEEKCFVFKQENSPYFALNELKKSEELIDVRLEVGSKQLSAHRVVLAATIPYFRTMFTIKMRERSDDVITLEANIDESSFESIIDYAYGAEIRITSHNVQSLMVAALFFRLDRVLEACSQFLEKSLNISNVLQMQAWGDNFGFPSLVESSNTFVRNHFEEVAKLEDFFLLRFNQIEEIISKDELNISCEEKVFEAIITWVKRDENARKDFLSNLLTHVRLPLLTPEYLIGCIGTEQLVRNSHSCRDLLDEAKDYHLNPKGRQLLQSVRTTPRYSNLSGLIYAVGGQGESNGSVNTVEVYNHYLNTWALEVAMKTSRQGLGIAVIHDNLYAIGGREGCIILKTVEVFDAKAKRWTNVAPMNCKRRNFGAATLNDKLYVCGGYDGTSLKTVECYDHEKDEWQMLPCMSQNRNVVGVVAFQGSIVALGGKDNGVTDSVERFDPQTNIWTGMPSMKTKRDGLGVAVLNNKIYVCGGWDGSTGLQSAEVFDPQTNEWSFIASMNVKRCNVVLAANGGKLFAIGGYDGKSYLSSVEMYNPDINEWSFVAPMSEPKNYVGVGVIPFANSL